MHGPGQFFLGQTSGTAVKEQVIERGRQHVRWIGGRTGEMNRVEL